MKAPIIGICCGFRVRTADTKKDSDFAVIDVLQPGDVNYDSTLVQVFCDQPDQIEYFLSHYSSGQLRWIELYCVQIQQGREKVWYLQDVLMFSDEHIPILDKPNESISAIE